MEISKQLNNHTLISSVVIFLSKLFFYCCRRIAKIFPITKGNVIVISLHKIGDSVLTIPAIREIQNYYNKKIIILCYHSVVPIFKLGLENVEYAIMSPNDFYFDNRIANRRSRKILKSFKPEIIFDLNGVMTTATLIFNSRAGKIVGMGREQFKTIYDHFVPIKRNSHLMDIYIDAVSPVVSIKNPDLIKEYPVNFNKSEKILIIPLAGWKAKEWNFNKFIKLAEYLKLEYKTSIILEANYISDDIIAEIKNNKIEVITTGTVTELIEQIKECSVCIGNDSGPLQIASLLGKLDLSNLWTN